MKDPVQTQYEAYPYPPRDPADEANRLITGSPSHPAEIEHFVFAGRLDRGRPFRALVAGGGTGDATVMLAQLLADRGMTAEIVHLDVSAPSIAVAEARVAVRGLGSVRFVEGSLLDLAALGLGTFDYIDCCGVLHHLDDPDAGLAALAAALSPDGGLGAMLYAPFGRTGVYPMQSMLRMIAGEGESAQRLATAKRLLASLPETNWLRRNSFVGDHRSMGDAGIYDLLLHARDRPYTVPEIDAFLARAGLAPVAFLDPLRYDPAVYLRDPDLIAKVRQLSPIERCAFAELLCGNMKSHVFYAVPAARAEAATLRLDGPDGPELVPLLRDGDGAALGARAQPGGTIRAEYDGITLRVGLPQLAPQLLSLIDGERSVGEIHAALDAAVRPDWPVYLSEFGALYAAFHGLGRMFLRRR